MADIRTSQRRSQPRASARGKPWMSERQLDAYLQARDMLRRLRDAALLTSNEPRADSPPRSAT